MNHPRLIVLNQKEEFISIQRVTWFHFSDNSAAVEWLISSHLHIHAWKCLLDQESYVRATAVTFISKMLPIPTIWQSLMKEIQMSEVNCWNRTNKPQSQGFKLDSLSLIQISKNLGLKILNIFSLISWVLRRTVSFRWFF